MLFLSWKRSINSYLNLLWRASDLGAKLSMDWSKAPTSPWSWSIPILQGSNPETSRKILTNLKYYKSILLPKKKKENYACSNNSCFYRTLSVFWEKFWSLTLFKWMFSCWWSQQGLNLMWFALYASHTGPALHPSRSGSVIVFVDPNCCLLHRHKWLEFSLWIGECPLHSCDSMPNSNLCYKIIFCCSQGAVIIGTK